MQNLGKREEQIMRIIWHLGKAFVREIIDEMPNPKPHYNTVATMVKILVKKGFLQAEKLGNSYRYNPQIKFDEYKKQQLRTIKKNFFGNSFTRMITHFAKQEDLSNEDLDELIRIIQSEKTKKP